MNEPDVDRSEEQCGSPITEASQAAQQMVTISHQKVLLQVARDAIASFLGTGVVPALDLSDPALSRPLGVFVTLRDSSDIRGGQPGTFLSAPEGRLRGCVGRIQADLPLYRGVQEMAIKAATSDPRFPPITILELPQIHIEISVLSTLFPVSSLDEIRIGVHGLLIEGSGRRGVLLPKVPLTRGWGREEFLENLCLKAGLPSGSWPGKSQLFSFSAVDFGEP